MNRALKLKPPDHEESSSSTSSPGAAPFHPLLALQRTAGNHAVAALLEEAKQASAAAPSCARCAAGLPCECTSAAHPVVQRAARGSPNASAPPEPAPADHASGHDHPRDTYSDRFPYLDLLQRSFGPAHDLGTVRAVVGRDATGICERLDAEAYAEGEHVGFSAMPSLRLAAHEAAHVVQQRAGLVHPDMTAEQEHEHERHADSIADRVMAGHSAADLLPPPGRRGTASAILRKKRESASSYPYERAWAKEHPEGNVTEVEPGHWILWNFDVASATLKPEHVRQLDEIARDTRMMHGAAVLKLDGHASRSGTEQENEGISAHRVKAVFDYLFNSWFSSESGRNKIGRTETDNHGFSRPWWPNTLGISMAHNRRVEVRIVSPAPPPRKDKTMEIPDPGPIHLPERPEAPEAPETPGVVDYTFQFKIPIDPKVPIPIVGGCFLLYPRGEIAVNVTLLRGGKSVFTVDQKLKMKFEKELAEHVKIEATSSGSIILKYEDIHLGDFTVNTGARWGGFEDPDKMFVYANTVAFKGEAELFGHQFEAEYLPKVEFGVGPGPLALHCVPPAIAGGVAAGGAAAAFILYSMYYANKQHEEGRRDAGRWNYLSGYAWRMAAFAMDDRSWVDQAATYVNRLRGKDEDAYRHSWTGWMAADGALAVLPPGQKMQLAKALRPPRASLNSIWEQILYRMSKRTFDYANPMTLIEP